MNPIKNSSRIESIDLLRGIVIIIMSLDHIRDYFHAPAYLYDPTDLQHTSVPIFFTRWITHFCAPVFVFLAGTSAFQVGLRKGKNELAAFLLKRGIWLIIMELTIINFAWFFNVSFTFIPLTVIWVLGVSMVALAAIIYLPFPAIFAIGALMVLGHNAMDTIHVAGNGSHAFLWALFHEQNIFQFGRFLIFAGYPLVPWVGVMALGYCFGSLYVPAFDQQKRKKILIYLGSFSILGFILIRAINIYGDLHPWAQQATPALTVLSFFNTTKYPPSLLYLLMTLGPAFLFLAFSEKLKGAVANSLLIFGRVPMFYYITHIYLIHLLALIAVVATGYQVSDMVFNTWITLSPALKGYGFGLVVVYAVWVVVNAILYPACKWYEQYKRDHKDKWWLSYL